MYTYLNVNSSCLYNAKSISVNVCIFVRHSGQEGSWANNTFPFQRQRYADDNIKEALLLCQVYSEFSHHCTTQGVQRAE